MKYFFITRLLKPLVPPWKFIWRNIVWPKFPVIHTRNYQHQPPVAPIKKSFDNFVIGHPKNNNKWDGKQSKKHDKKNDNSQETVKVFDPISRKLREYKFLYEIDGKFAYEKIANDPERTKQMSEVLKTIKEDPFYKYIAEEENSATKLDFNTAYKDIFIFNEKLKPDYVRPVVTSMLQTPSEENKPPSNFRSIPLKPSL